MVRTLALVLQSVIRGGDGMRRVRFSINIPAELVDRLDRLAKEANTSRSRMAENILLFHTRNMDEGGKDHGEENGRKEA